MLPQPTGDTAQYVPLASTSAPSPAVATPAAAATTPPTATATAASSSGARGEKSRLTETLLKQTSEQGVYDAFSAKEMKLLLETNKNRAKSDMARRLALTVPGCELTKKEKQAAAGPSGGIDAGVNRPPQPPARRPQPPQITNPAALHVPLVTQSTQKPNRKGSNVQADDNDGGGAGGSGKSRQRKENIETKQDDDGDDGSEMESLAEGWYTPNKEVVWVKYAGAPWWPALMAEPLTAEQLADAAIERKKGATVFVIFYPYMDECSYACVKPKGIKPFNAFELQRAAPARTYKGPKYVGWEEARMAQALADATAESLNAMVTCCLPLHHSTIQLSQLNCFVPD